MSQLVYHCQFFGCGREILKQKPGPIPKYCVVHKREAIKIRNRLRLRKKRGSGAQVICHRCRGKIIKLHRKWFCSDYCAWLAETSRHSKGLAKLLKEFRMTRMVK